MHATLKFQLPEESEQHQMAINGSKYYCLIQEVHNFIRRKFKVDITEDQATMLEELKELINEEMEGIK